MAEPMMAMVMDGYEDTNVAHLDKSWFHGRSFWEGARGSPRLHVAAEDEQRGNPEGGGNHWWALPRGGSGLCEINTTHTNMHW